MEEEKRKWLVVQEGRVSPSTAGEHAISFLQAWGSVLI